MPRPSRRMVTASPSWSRRSPSHLFAMPDHSPVGTNDPVRAGTCCHTLPLEDRVGHDREEWRNGMALELSSRRQRTSEGTRPVEDGPSVRIRRPSAIRSAIEGSITGDRAVVVVHGEATSPCLPELATTLDGMVASEPSNLTVDLSQTSGMDVATVRAIARRGCKVSQFDVRLPETARPSEVALPVGLPAGPSDR